MRTVFKLISALVLALVIALGVFSQDISKILLPKHADAAGLYPTVVFPTFTGSINTEAVIATAAASTHLTIHAMQVASSSAGIVVFKDGTAGTTIANIYLAANTPTLIGQDVFGAGGLKCTATDRTITATLSGATLTILMRCDQGT